MRLSDDYRGDMRRTRVSDREIELLLSGELSASEQWSNLTPLVEAMRSQWSYELSEPDVQRFAASAASVVQSLPTISTTSGAGDRRWQRRGLTPRLATIAVFIALMSATAGIAFAANGAVPGDALYGLDRALERVGIGSGSTEERLDEAVVMAAQGRSGEALQHAIEALSRQGGDASEAAVGALTNAVENLVDTEDTADAATAASIRVTALLTYIADNIGIDVGTDGREFGQGVAQLVRDIGEGDDPTGAPNPAVAPAPSQGQSNNPGSGTGNEGTDDGTGPGNGQDNGPPTESPSVTAPSQDNGPPLETPSVTVPSRGTNTEDSPSATAPDKGNKP